MEARLACQPCAQTQRTQQVVELDLSPNNHKAPSIVFVARESGNEAPQAWFAGKETLAEGLATWIRPMLDAYRRIYNDSRPAVLVAGINVKTRFTPAPQSAVGFIDQEDDSKRKSDKLRAMKFTKAIIQMLENAPDKPVLVSIGSDGFSCDTMRLQAFFERVRAFDLVTRLKTLTFSDGVKMSSHLLTKDEDAWWAKVETSAILNCLRQSVTLTDQELVKEFIRL